MPLPAVLTQLTAAKEEMALVIDEYGGFAGVVTVEDMAEELVGEIDDEHDVDPEIAVITRADDSWLIRGDAHLDEVGRAIGHDLPDGDYETLAGLILARFGGLPEVGDTVELQLAGTAEELLHEGPPRNARWSSTSEPWNAGCRRRSACVSAPTPPSATTARPPDEQSLDRPRRHRRPDRGQRVLRGRRVRAHRRPPPPPRGRGAAQPLGARRLRSASELSVLLAGSQLGITVCTLALGAVTKPAVHHWLTPLIAGWGAPTWAADAAGFVLALFIVTFLHLVIGEMAPKSWAIAHPEKSATLLAIPMRGFMWFTRPLIVWLNRLANLCLRKVGSSPSTSWIPVRTPRRCDTWWNTPPPWAPSTSATAGI